MALQSAKPQIGAEVNEFKQVILDSPFLRSLQKYILHFLKSIND